MKVTFLGAAGGEVTGSSYLLELAHANIMVDCGMFQGSNKLENHNRLPKRERIGKLDAVVLTHAHLDHTGRLPLLTRFGYKGPIYATPATIDLTDVILRDSARLQAEDVKRTNRRRVEKGQAPLEALYTNKQVEQLKKLFKPMKYNHPTQIAPGVWVRAVEAGHILGSASLEFTIEENGMKKVVVFSGDLGPRGAPLHRDPTPFKHADVVFMESTYGDRDHPSLQETALQARDAINEAISKHGRVLVPTFAIGRTQILLYLLAGAFKRKTMQPFPIFVDSPMAIEATTLYKKHRELFDEEALAMATSGELAKQLRTLQLLPKPADSKSLAKRQGPFLVMAGAGMCTGGRILHHLVNHLSDPTTLVLMVGYQSRGSVGRAIVDGAPWVRIMGKKIAVKAKVQVLGGMSGHAGQRDLLAWIGSLAGSKPRVLLTHGEDEPRKVLARLIKQRYGMECELPDYEQTIEI